MSSPAALTIAICLPAWNERDNLTVLLDEIATNVVHPLVGEAHVIVFDDASDDATAEHFAGKLYPGFTLHVVHSLVRVGKSAGLAHAFGQALLLDVDAVIMMDADLQDDPRHIPELLASLAEGHDVVNGYRANRRHSAGKRLSSKLFNKSVRTLTGLRLLDINSGFKAFSPAAARALAPYLYGELHRVVLVIAVWIGLHVGEVRVINRDRIHGKTSYGVARGWRGIFDMWTVQFLRRYHASPGHFFSGIGVILLVSAGVVLGVGWGLFVSGAVAVVPGVTLWLAFALAFFGATFVSFGFLAELVLFLSKSPPTSLVRHYDSGQSLFVLRSGDLTPQQHR